MSETIVIAGFARTPIGNFQGQFNSVTAPQLGQAAIKAAVHSSNIDTNDIEEVVMGCVLPAGLGQAPARQASIGAGLPNSIPCTTVNKMCGSGMQAVIFAHDNLKAGSNKIMVAGGMESMTNSPYVLPKARQGYRMGHQTVYDHMFIDGLEDAYDKGKLMGVFAEATAQKYKFSREAQDLFALTSLQRAKDAIESGAFEQEITPVTVKTRKETLEVTTDEGPITEKPDKIPQLKPAFATDGTVTAANSSSISDGAAAVVLTTESEAKKRGLSIYAKIVSHAVHAQDPSWFTTAPVSAMQKLLKKTKWNVGEVDLFEVNEAFAVVTMAAIHDLELDPERVNVHGGACTLGHPVGATGARIICSLIAAMHRYDKQRGIASLCIGGGEAAAIALERI